MFYKVIGMASEKTKNTLVALVHGFVYAVCFIPLVLVWEQHFNAVLVVKRTMVLALAYNK